MDGRILFLLCVSFLASCSATKLRTAYEWKYVDYVWYNTQQRNNAILSGEYNYTKPVILDVDRSRDGRTFVTVLRDDGVPASLNTVSRYTGPGGPLLAPYPNWDWAKKGDCNAITNVYRVAIDECNRLWVLDTGKIAGRVVCPPQLLAFDLATDTFIKRVRFSANVQTSPHNGRGLFVTPIVETEGARCARTTIYMADVDGGGLVIYDGDKLVRLDAEVYAADVKKSIITIEGERFQLVDGVLGMALSPKSIYDGSRALLFRPLASYDLYMTSTDDLKHASHREVRYQKAENVLPSQAVAQAFSSDGTLFFGLTTETSIGCWNIYHPMVQTHMWTAVKDRKTLQFTSGMKVIKNLYGVEELWVSSNRLQKFMTGSRNFNEVNFRVLYGRVSDLVSGTDCRQPHTGSYEQEDDYYPRGHENFRPSHGNVFY